MNLKKPHMPTISVTTRHWKHLNIQDLCYDIESQLENVNLEDGELDSCVNVFESTVRNILDDHAPLKTRTVKLQSESPWFNDDIRAARKTRHQLERKWRDNGKLEVHRQAKIDHYGTHLLWKRALAIRKNSLTLLKSCFINPRLQCFHLHTPIRTSQMHFQTLLLQKFRTSVVLSPPPPQNLPFYHKHSHTRTHIVDSLCLSLLVLWRSRNSSWNRHQNRVNLIQYQLR